MKKFILSLVVLGVLVPMAHAQPLVRGGTSYDGIANPGGCSILTEVQYLFVDCRGASDDARIRYRFVDVAKGPGEFTATLHRYVGRRPEVLYMANPNSPRTGRITVWAGTDWRIQRVRLVPSGA